MEVLSLQLPQDPEQLPVTDLSAISKQQGQRAEEGMAL
jgi:hypothetical protein